MISLEQGTVCKPLFLQLFLFSVSLKSDYCVTPQSRPAIVLGEIKKKGGGGNPDVSHGGEGGDAYRPIDPEQCMQNTGL